VDDPLTLGSDGDFARLNFDSATRSVQNFRAEVSKAGDGLKDIGRGGDDMSRALSGSMNVLSREMSNAFERFARTGKFSFQDLKSVAISVLDSIFERAVSAGLNSLFGGSSGGGGFLGSLFGSFGGFSFAPRATGGPVDAGRAFLVGEAGPEIFVPGQSGQVMRPQAPSASPIHITVNMQGSAGASPSALRQSASQVVSQVSRAVTRAQRNG